MPLEVIEHPQAVKALPLHELFPVFFAYPPCAPAPLCSLGVHVNGHSTRIFFDLEQESLPAILDAIWTAAAEQWLELDQALNLSHNVIRDFTARSGRPAC